MLIKGNFSDKYIFKSLVLVPFTQKGQVDQITLTCTVTIICITTQKFTITAPHLI